MTDTMNMDSLQVEEGQEEVLMESAPAEFADMPADIAAPVEGTDEFSEEYVPYEEEAIAPEGPVEEQPAQEAPAAEGAETAEDREKLRQELIQEAASHRRPRRNSVRPGTFRDTGREYGITIDAGENAEDPEAAKKRESEIEIYQSLTRGWILTGKVMGVNRMQNSSNDSLFFVQVKKDNYEVLIPYDRFTETDFDALLDQWRQMDPNRTKAEAIQRYLRDRLNADVDFVVSEVIPDPESSGIGLRVAGDRLTAMRNRRIIYWYGVNRSNGEYRLQVGTRVQARIIMTARGGIRVEVFGVETFIRNAELAYTFIQDARTEFEVGQKVWVRLTEINRNQDEDYAVTFQASVRLAQEDPRERAASIYTPGSIYAGVINYLRLPTPEHPENRPAVFVRLAHEGIQVSCPFPNSPVPPLVGARCTVTITNVNPKNMRLYGIINHINPN